MSPFPFHAIDAANGMLFEVRPRDIEQIRNRNLVPVSSLGACGIE